MDDVIPVIVGSLSGILVVLLKVLFDDRRTDSEKTELIRIKYLQPLRLYLEECFTRLDEIKHEVEHKSDRANALTLVSGSQEITDKDANWFNNDGCYLASTAYFIACLFWSIDRTRRSLPYLQLKGQKDTELLNRMFDISHAVLQNHGVYYAIQHSIGTELDRVDGEGPVSYREFCELIGSDQHWPWFDRLLQWLIDAGNNNRKEDLQGTITAIQNLLEWLDFQLKGANTINTRKEREKAKQV